MKVPTSDLKEILKALCEIRDSIARIEQRYMEEDNNEHMETRYN